MKHVAYVLFALTLLPALGCGDDAPAAPGAIDVKWTLGPVATCGSLHLTRIEARAYRGTTLENTVSADCPANGSSGTLTIDELTPAKYKVVVEGFDATDKGTWLIESTSLTVSSGKTAESPQLRLEEKPAALIVDWTLPGGKCATSNIDRVEVTLFDSQGKELAGRTQTVDCDATFPDPEDGETTAGALFEDLEPIEGMVVLGYGLSTSGTKVARGQVSGINLGAGDKVTKIVALDTCDQVDCEGQ